MKEYNYYLKNIRMALNHIDIAYSNFTKFNKHNNMENNLNNHKFKSFNLGMHHLNESAEILSTAEIELATNLEIMEGKHE